MSARPPGPSTQPGLNLLHKTHLTKQGMCYATSTVMTKTKTYSMLTSVKWNHVRCVVVVWGGLAFRFKAVTCVPAHCMQACVLAALL